MSARASIKLLYFSDFGDQCQEKEVYNLPTTDSIFYMLDYDGYVAYSDKNKTTVYISVIKGMNIDQLQPFFTITSGSSGLPSEYFCPTILDVCPDNPSVLDILSNCESDIRVVKFLKTKEGKMYNLFDSNTLNHPYISQNQDQFFCSMGNELIVSSGQGSNDFKLFGRATKYEGALSFHTFNFENFGFTSITSVKCLSFARSFVVYGLGKKLASGSFENLFAVIFGNKAGVANQKYALVVNSQRPAIQSFAVTPTQILTYYSRAESKEIEFDMIYTNGPLIDL